MYFTTKTQNRSRAECWQIDHTLLAPQLGVCSKAGDFCTAYLLQLEQILFNTHEQPQLEHIMELARLLRRFTHFGKPVVVKSSAMVRLLPQVVQTLNLFFHTHMAVIASVSAMVLNERVNDITGASA